VKLGAGAVADRAFRFQEGALPSAAPSGISLPD
jgi:hypothetical protein